MLAEMMRTLMPRLPRCRDVGAGVYRRRNGCDRNGPRRRAGVRDRVRPPATRRGDGGARAFAARGSADATGDKAALAGRHRRGRRRFALQFVALGLGSLAVVQPLLVSGLLI